MTTVFELFAKLGLDTTDYESGLKGAKSAAESIGGAIGGGLKTAAKIGMAAVGAATTAVTAFGATSVKAGGEFDKSMSQVAATMGLSTSEMEKSVGTVDLAWGKFSGNLRDYAKEMGRNTAFSAKESADALNYMALAGYDVQTSMQMLPNVLNLAAAGGMELANASDMVTDAQSALGLSLDETSDLVGKMAQASSKSNTSVSQLGEAILTIGGTAKNLAGGTTELSQALGLLADNGIKGAEGGTALRNILLNLTPKSKDAAVAMQEIGLNAYDAEGKMRPLKDIFTDLNNGLEGMTDEQKTNVLSTIFNKVDLKSVNALLATNVDRWDELGEAIDNSSGAAQKMADTQLDNLAGDMTLFQSALEGAQIEVSEKLTPSLRDFVQLGTSGLSNITAAFKSGGLTGAMGAFGDTLAQGLNLITDKLPSFVDAGMQLLGALGQGIIDNIPTIADASVQIVTQLADGLVQALPQLANGAITLVESLGQSLSENAPKLLETGQKLLEMIGNGITNGVPLLIAQGLPMLVQFSAGLRQNAGKLVDAGIDMIMKLADGLIDGLPTMIETIPQIVINIAGIINDNAPKLLVAGAKLIVKLAEGIIKAIPTLVANIPKIFEAILAVWSALNWVSLGTNLINFIVNGVKSLAKAIPTALKDIGTQAVTLFKSINWADVGRTAINVITSGVTGLATAIPNALKAIGTAAINAFKGINWVDVGRNVINGIVSGVKAMASTAVEAVVGVGKKMYNGVKGFFGIHSPSRLMADGVGKFIPEGIAVGIDQNVDSVIQSMKNIADIVAQPITPTVGEISAENASNDYTAGNTVTINVYGAQGQSVETLADLVADKINNAVTAKRRVFA